MRTALSVQQRLTVTLWLIVATFVLFVAMFVVYVRAEKAIDRANEIRIQSLALANEMKQSSDDLTRMARTYVITGERGYRERFQTILDLREGKLGRPEGYNRFYWDLIGAQGEAPQRLPAISLLDQMRALQATDIEFQLLAEAKSQSDKLAEVEFKAMAMVASEVGGRTARDMAIDLLHNEAYHLHKALIMRPLHELSRLLDERTLLSVREAEGYATWTRGLLVLIGVLLTLFSLGVRHSVKAILGTSVEDLYARMEGIGNGNFEAKTDEEVSDTVLGKLMDTQRKLAEQDARRHRAEGALIVSEQRFRDLVNSTDGIVWEADATTFEFTFVSQQAERLLGFPVQDWHRPGFWVDQLHPDDRQWAPQYCAKCTGRLEAHDFEYRFMAKDGRTVWLHDMVTVVSEDGHPRWLRGIMVDITRQKKNEQELERHRSQLELLVSERTRELAEKNQALQQTLTQLQAAQQDLVQSSKLASLGELVAGVAHELNTPIGNALTVSSTLVDQGRAVQKNLADGHLTRQEFDEFLDQVAEGGQLLTGNLERASDLIRSFKQVAVDRTSSQRRVFDLRQVTGEVVATLHPVLRKTPFKVRLMVPEGICMEAYPGPLGQVIVNLVENAIVHGLEGCEHGEVIIDASAGNEEDKVIFTVSDDGRGIPREHLGRIFDPFFTTRLGLGGSGLGLNIVFNIVNGLLGGQIRVESPRGPEASGTRFILELPLVAPIHGDEYELNALL